MAKYFLDANIILDLIDNDRGNLEKTRLFVKEAILSGDRLYTSCDIFTTVYYVASKKLSPLQIMDELDRLLIFMDVIAIDMDTIKEAMALVKENEDFEDILQYVCAGRGHCSAIITNDKKFYRGKIEVRSLS